VGRAAEHRAPIFVRKPRLGIVRFCHGGECRMAEPLDEVEIERIIAVALNRHARGDVEALTRGVIADLRDAGFEIRRADAIPIRRNPGDRD
jgi:hypothetical protein